MPVRSCFSWGTCLSSPFRMVTTKCSSKPEKVLLRDRILPQSLEPRFVSPMANVLSNQLTVGRDNNSVLSQKGKLYEINMYNLIYTLSDFHLNLIAKKPRKQHLFLGQRTSSSPRREVCILCCLLWWDQRLPPRHLGHTIPVSTFLLLLKNIHGMLLDMDTRPRCMEPVGFQACTEVPLLGHPQQ